MAIRPFQGQLPQIAEGAFVDEQAVVIGDVQIGADSSIWPMAVLRGDVNHIRIGARSSVQDGSVLHVTHDHAAQPGGFPLLVGDDVTIGHNVTLHGCTIGNRCLVGMGSTVLDGAVLEEGVFLAAGSLVPPGKRLEGGFLWVGSPVKKARPLTEAEEHWLGYSAQHYLRLKDKYL
ncbi:MAG: gamma carbonic anhydrase family protein [Gammaproteobacteria bacterium]|nr:gamma carbonic anhydrase family protein [Gammaproteobacteria bacterium]